MILFIIVFVVGYIIVVYIFLLSYLLIMKYVVVNWDDVVEFYYCLSLVYLIVWYIVVCIRVGEVWFIVIEWNMKEN